MADMLAEIGEMVKEFGSAPTFAEMPRRLLTDKGIARTGILSGSG